jgi:hypothetical protein
MPVGLVVGCACNGSFLSCWRSVGVCVSVHLLAGYVYKYDLSLPLRDMYQLVEVTRDRLAKFADSGVYAVSELVIFMGPGCGVRIALLVSVLFVSTILGARGSRS